MVIKGLTCMGSLLRTFRRPSSRPLLLFRRGISYYDDLDHITRPDWRIITDGRRNKGLAFTIEERQRLGIQGLLPCTVRSMEDQMLAIETNFYARPANLNRYTYLSSLQYRHRRIYYRFIRENIEQVLPIVYTPTMGDVVTTFGLNFQIATSLYVSIFDKGHIVELLHNWTERNVRAICVTDGGRVLGLGDMGANGMGITVGKMVLYTALAGVPPSLLMPVCLDVGTDNQALLQDPLYVGMRIPRVRGPEYDELVQEFMEAAVECFGHDTFIHFEDFSTPDALKFLEKYQDSYCYFNDDVQGTGATGVAGFLNVERITGRKLEDTTFLFAGAGSASLGIANMLATELEERGVPADEVAKNIFLQDHIGLFTCDRTDGGEPVKRFLKPIEGSEDLLATIQRLKPSILVGATGHASLFTEEILKTMAKNHKLPAVFALSNPTAYSECTAEQAYCHTEGRVLFCSGSPFPPVVINGKRYSPSQANNCLTFPGIALGAISSSAQTLPNSIYPVVARTLADCVSQERLDAGALYPPIKDAHEVALKVGAAVAQFVFDNDLSNINPKPEDVSEFVQRNLYKMEYRSSLISTYDYPETLPMPKKETKKEA
ncbi:NADP-dependent malic enzyme [Drosophila kikkawai]|uniref:NADP-dependent malic enzyme n=1 Tax=Drosophila kikkawai TaxID=30033 RepID=A0A6P4I722_DROKI|nr:NADP-dependent malic enzyme [Drosophila kikkawai]